MVVDFFICGTGMIPYLKSLLRKLNINLKCYKEVLAALPSLWARGGESAKAAY